MHISGIANNAVSFSGMVKNLNSKKCNNIYFAAKVSTFPIAVLVLGNLFWAKYPASISFIVTGKCVPLSTFLCIILNILSISACFGKISVPDCLYQLDFVTLKVLGKMTYLAFCMSLKLLLLELESFP